MIYLENTIAEKVAYVIPIGDLHFGDKAFKKKSRDKLDGYVRWIRSHPEARVVLGGDLLNCASRLSKTSPFEQRMSLDDEMEIVMDILEPIKSQIAGAIEGNHEERLRDFFDLSPTKAICGRLKIPYMGMSGVIVFKVGKRTDTRTPNKFRIHYPIYFHHTTGGGSTIGGGLNRVEKLGFIMENVDCYCGFHSHKLSSSRSTIYCPNIKSKKVEEKTITHLTCGGYLEYSGSYAEKGMMRPTKLGSPRIRLDGTRKDLHCSL